MERIPVTAIVPCFGGIPTIERALASIAAQTMPPMETLIVDDGNPPESARSLEAIAARFSSISARVIHLPENRGLASARNAGWREAQGRYVAFLDDDDAWHPRKLELQAALMERAPGIALTAHDLPFCAAAEPVWETPPVPLVLRAYRSPQLLITNPTRAPSFMLRADSPVRFLEGRRHVEDYQLFLEIVLRGLGARHIDFPLGAMFKPGFGAIGLSSQLWKMGRGELETYAQLHRAGLLSGPGTRALQIVALLKLGRRAAIAKVLRPLGLTRD